MSAMLSLEEAQARLLALAPHTQVSQCDVRSAQRRFLAQDVRAKRTQPVADLSAMDGYAIAGDGPWERIGESRAGLPFGGKLSAGECVRISTGAHMPQGADRVLIQENATVSGSQVTATDVPDSGRHVRRAGFDFAEGDIVLRAGSEIGAGQISLAIASGNTSVPVKDRPNIAILESGDELSGDPTQCGPHQIPASNGAMISALLSPIAGPTEVPDPVPDNLDALANALAKLESAQIIITSGGASVGDHDLIQHALRTWGAEINFWKVAIKPGKPLMVATRQGAEGHQVILGLPGNPVSSFVTAFLFALPLVRKAMGANAPMPKTHHLNAAHDLPVVGMRREFLRGIREGQSVRLAASQDSSALLALASANCLIDRPAGAPAVKAGDVVPVYNLRNG